MPRKFGPHDQAVLQELAATAIAELEDVHTAARERELRDFIDTAGTLIQSVDETGRVRMINRAWTAAVGYSTAEALGKNIFDIIDPAEQEHWRATLAKLLASDLPCALETNFMTKDGRKLRVTGVLNTLKRPDGTHAIRGVFQDVTAQRELERIRSEITHHVSHELKTPLTVTTVALHMMEESNHELSAEQSQLLGTALKGVSHLSRMVDDLMDASRSDSGKMRLDVAPNDLNPFLTNIDNAFNPLATRNGMALTVEHVDPKIRAMFDPVRLRQILSNLIVNAMKFSPKGGHITIGTKEGPEGSIEIFVRDTGIGIKIGDLDRIFDRLYQTSNKVQKGETGLGLGLHICRELVLVHGGRIWVTSNLGEGTTFHFTLLLA